MMDDYLWCAILGGVLCFTLGFGMGANDVANNFGTSVGSKSISLKKALVIAAIFELIGSVGLGASVTDSLRTGVFDATAFGDMPDFLLVANLTALAVVTIWLIAASMTGMTVSTTHSLVGAMLGCGLAFGGGAIHWDYILKLVIVWFVGPICSGILGAVFFVIVRRYILRAGDPVKRGLRALSFLLFFLCCTCTFFFLYKNPLTLDGVSCRITNKAGEVLQQKPCKVKDWASSNPKLSLPIAFGSGAGLTLIGGPLLYWWALRRVKRFEAAKLAQKAAEQAALTAQIEEGNPSNLHSNHHSNLHSSLHPHSTETTPNRTKANNGSPKANNGSPKGSSPKGNSPKGCTPKGTKGKGNSSKTGNGKARELGSHLAPVEPPHSASRSSSYSTAHPTSAHSPPHSLASVHPEGNIPEPDGASVRGPIRDGSIRDGSMRDGSVREGSLREGSGRDGSVRGSGRSGSGSGRSGSGSGSGWEMGTDGESEFEGEDSSGAGCTAQAKQMWDQAPWNQDLHAEVYEDKPEANELMELAEKFDERCEAFFGALQTMSAAIACMVHGSNDVSNATAPFASVYSIYQDGVFEKSVSVPIWILVLGGSAISVGLMVLGYRVIKRVGIELFYVSASRGFCVEMALSVIMLIASFFGWPVSTTHVGVGAMIGIGMMEKHIDLRTGQDITQRSLKIFNLKAINWKLASKFATAWILTIVICGVAACAVFSFTVFTPTKVPRFVACTDLGTC